jgi:hypothetical protein
MGQVASSSTHRDRRRITPREVLIVEELANTSIPPSTFEHRSRERRDAA